MNIYHSTCPSCGNEADHLMDGNAIAVRCVHCGTGLANCRRFKSGV